MQDERSQTDNQKQRSAVNPPSSTRQQLHCLADLLRREDTSVSTAARRLGVSPTDVKRQIEPDYDLNLSDLYRWQEVFKVPIAELLGEPSDDLCSNVTFRGQLLRTMKTARTIQSSVTSESQRDLVNVLINELIECMAELANVDEWPRVGKRRTKEEQGRVAEFMLPDTFFEDFGSRTSTPFPHS